MIATLVRLRTVFQTTGCRTTRLHLCFLSPNHIHPSMLCCRRLNKMYCHPCGTVRKRIRINQIEGRLQWKTVDSSPGIASSGVRCKQNFACVRSLPNSQQSVFLQGIRLDVDPLECGHRGQPLHWDLCGAESQTTAHCRVTEWDGCIEPHNPRSGWLHCVTSTLNST